MPLNPTTGGANCGNAPNIPGFTAGPRLPNTPGNQAEYDEASLATNVHPRLPRYGRLTHEQERLGVTVALQARPWEGALFTVDLLHARPAGDAAGGFPRGDLVQPHRRPGRQAADQRRPGRI